jgi:hypothetical protein
MPCKQFYRLNSVERNRSRYFRRFFAMGKIRGTLCMRSHISPHRATTKYFCNSFVLKTNIEKEGLPRDRTPDLGAGAHLHLKSLISEFAYSYHSKVMQKWMPNSVFTFGASFLESREERSSSSI